MAGQRGGDIFFGDGDGWMGTILGIYWDVQQLKILRII